MPALKRSTGYSPQPRTNSKDNPPNKAATNKGSSGFTAGAAVRKPKGVSNYVTRKTVRSRQNRGQ